VIPEGKATPEDVVWGADIWHLMVDYRKKSDDLLAKLEGASLSADKQELVKKARELYDAFDFLDSYRLLTAAAS
jgi:sulfur relay (sulfurtransferase) DsrC/TusE family protein